MYVCHRLHLQGLLRGSILCNNKIFTILILLLLKQPLPAGGAAPEGACLCGHYCAKNVTEKKMKLFLDFFVVVWSDVAG